MVSCPPVPPPPQSGLPLLSVLGLAVIAAGLGYLLGSLPAGVIVCRMVGKDPRLVGSGRTGGTNVYRTAGLPAASATVALDVLKGAVAAWLGFRMAGALPAGFAAGIGVAPVSPDWSTAWLAASCGALAAIVGHNYSILAGFRGGAGSSPNLGAIFVLDPWVALAGFLASVVMLVGTRIASLASLSLAVIVLVAELWRVAAHAMPPAVLLYSVGQFVLVMWALRPNLARLRAGTERRIGSRESPGPDPGAGPLDG